MSDFLSGVADRVAPVASRYYDDPVAWADAYIKWPEGKSLRGYQKRALRRLVQKGKSRGRLSVRSLHGAGKTTLAAILILWFAETRERAGVDWKAITTASAWRQVTKYLWPEVHKWARLLDWQKLGRRQWNRDELRVLSIKLEHGEAFAVVSDDHEKIEGAHADEILFVFDEAKAIPAKTFDAVEGAFAGTGVVYVLSISTPGEPQGRFYEIQSRAKGYEDWDVLRVLLEEVVGEGQVDPKWVEDRRRQWGEESPIFLNRVLGEFAVVDDAGVIPLSWVEAAQARWEDFHANCDKGHRCDPGLLETVGVDPARSGEDKTAWATRYSDDHIYKITARGGLTTMETTGFVHGLLDTSGAKAVVDVIGIGAGVVDRLTEQFDSKRVIAFNASESTKAKDSSGELSFFSCRAAVWWHMREVLDPENGRNAMLPPDDELIGELTCPKWWVDSAGRIRVESKDEIRKRIGRSTNKADAVIQAFWPDLLAKKVLIAAPFSMTSTNYWRAAG